MAELPLADEAVAVVAHGLVAVQQKLPDGLVASVQKGDLRCIVWRGRVGRREEGERRGKV